MPLVLPQAAIKGVRKVIARASDEEVAAALSEGSLLRSLFVAFGHEVADVRKANTFCLVDLRLVRSAFLNPVRRLTSAASDMNCFCCQASVASVAQASHTHLIIAGSTLRVRMCDCSDSGRRRCDPTLRP